MKSPRGYWEAVINDESRVPRDRLIQKSFIATALSVPEGGVYFLHLTADGDLHKIFTQEQQDSLTQYVARTHPIPASRFLRDYYGHNEDAAFKGTDALFSGFHSWRENARAEAEGEQGVQPWHEVMMWLVNNTYMLPTQRKALISGLEYPDIYHITVANPEKIFTSSFKKVLVPRMEAAFAKQGFGSFLTMIDPKDKYFETFFELTARFGELPNVLEYASAQDITDIGGKLLALLERHPEKPDESDAVSLTEFMVAANALSHTKGAHKHLEDTLVREYAAATESVRMQNTLGVISAVYARAAARTDFSPEFRSLHERYPIADFSNLREDQIFTEMPDGTLQHVQRWFFVNSVDGRATQWYELQKFRQEGWRVDVEEKGGYVRVAKQEGRREVVIYMNMPTAFGVETGDESLESLLRDTRIHLVAVRGHSYDEEKIIPRAREAGIRNPSVFMYGSCGSNDAIDIAWSFADELGLPLPITATGTGDKINNHKILSGFAGEILARGNISFPKSWPKWGVSPDYVPPHENRPALVKYGMWYYDTQEHVSTERSDQPG